MKKVVIADHHPVTRKGITTILRKDQEFDIVGKASSGKKLRQVLQEKNPDILILEIDLPGVNGFNALRTFKEEFPEMRIVIFSCHLEEIYALRSIKSGAAGYIPKTSSTKIFLKALKKVAKGGIFLNEGITQSFSNPVVGETNVLNRYKKLSAREIEVLNLLSGGKKNKEIASVLDLNEKTISTYKTRLLKKLKVTNLAELIHQTRIFQLRML